MSAINDALRRASSAARNTPVSPAAPPPLPPMPVAPGSTSPTAPPPMASAFPPQLDANSTALPLTRPKSSPVLPILFSMLVLLCVAGAAGSYYYAKTHGPLLKTKFAALELEEEPGQSDAADSIEIETPEPTESAPNTSVASVPQAAIAKATAVAQTVAATRAPEPAPAPVPVAAPARPVTTAPVKFPALRLQSIFYRPSNPSVMINGKTLFISDEIQGVTVADIQPASVTLVLSGQTNILTLR